jgi:type I restriction enzyme M protein
VYDLRANMPQFGKRTQLMRQHFTEFEGAFGGDPLGGAAALKKRVDMGEEGRFRCFQRDWIAERNENLDIAWLQDDSDDSAEELPEPAALAQMAMVELEAVMAELQGILVELGEEVEV